jgi:hypothetical protein
MKKRVVVIGSGISAKNYLEHFMSDSVLIAILDSFGEGNINNTQVQTIDHITHLEFDQVIIASWAVDELALKLSALAIPKHKIVIFLNDRAKTVSLTHWQLEIADAKQPAIDDVLYAFYDLSVAYPTFDILGFVCLAEMARKKKKLQSIKFVIVYPESHYSNVELLPLMPAQEQSWRVKNILLPSCFLLPSCSGLDLCSDRSKAQQALETETHIFPEQYALDTPVAAWKFNLVIDKANAGESIDVLRSAPQALGLIDKWARQHNPQNKKIITITTRESSVQQLRNSNIPEWIKFVNSLDKALFLPVFVRDLEESFNAEALSPNCLELNACSLNLELRMALYERSYINLGVNNGPSHLWVFNQNCRYLMFKQITEGYHHSSEASFKDRNFEIGGHFPGAAAHQKFVWQDDNFEVISQEFKQLCTEIESIDKNTST